MERIPSWQYDEFKQVGVDYENQAEIEAYDSRHAQFRDIDAECSQILDTLMLTPQSVVIELGTGTGAFAIHAARQCAQVFAVDVSSPMLEFAQKNAQINIPRWIDHLGKLGGTQLEDEIATHVREEFSTFDWIIDGLLDRAGFKILSKKITDGVIGTYLCKAVENR